MKEQEVNYDRFREFPVCCDELGLLYRQDLMNLRTSKAAVPSPATARLTST